MAEIILGKSRAQEWFILGRVGKSVAVTVLLPSEDTILYYKSCPVAVETGGVVYWHQEKREAGATRAINAFCPDHPRISVSAEQFDFTLGSLLTKVGLRLTAKESI
jgi:hypothetical protein